MIALNEIAGHQVQIHAPRRTVTLADIELAARELAQARDILAAESAALETEIEAAKNRRLPRLKKLVEITTESETRLHELIEGAPELFEQPRTIVFHGLKIGFEKSRERVEISDEDRTVELIERHLSALASVLISVRKAPNKGALRELPDADLKRIGCAVESSGDVVVIRRAESEVEKTISALIKGGSAGVGNN